jgi:hypothetical protein
MRAKTAFFALLPLALALMWLVAGWRWSLASVVVVALGAVMLAARGLGDGAGRFFPAWLCMYAPLWVAERAVSTYWAFYWRVAHGGYPFGNKLIAKGTGRAWRDGGRGVPDNSSSKH